MAPYWFKNKTTLFGNWIALPEGSSRLSEYYKAIADSITWLHTEVYNSSWQGYVPSAYPQLAKHLEVLAKSLPSHLDLPVARGYALTLDWIFFKVATCVRISLTIITLIMYFTGYITPSDHNKFLVATGIGLALCIPPMAPWGSIFISCTLFGINFVRR